MSLSRKHFRELAVILGKNRATENIVFDVVNFCFIFDLYNTTKIIPSDIIQIDRLLKNHLISIFKIDNRRFDIGRYKDFIIDYLKKEYDFEINELKSVDL